ncbi:MAG: VanZ family protein [bacterium]
MKKLFKNWGPVIAYFALIFILSSIPVQVRPGVDKVLHVLEYALMGFFATRGVLLSWNLSRGMGIFLGGLMATALGVFDELHQYFVPGRSASPYDAMADLAGAYLGAALFVVLGTMLYGSHKLYPDAQQKCC